MEIDNRILASPDLEMTIDSNPLKIAPDMNLQDAVLLMSQTRNSSCSCDSDDDELGLSIDDRRSPSSCALIMDRDKLLGILTERDIVRLTASEKPFAELQVSQVMTHPVTTLCQDNFQDIFAALFLFRRYKIRHLPLVDKNNNLIGIISPQTIRQAMRPANLLKLRRVGDIMSKNIVNADRVISVLDIAWLMAEQKVSCIVITQQDKQENTLLPVGIITERDIMQFQSLELNLKSVTAQDVMSSPLFLLSPEDSLLKANQEMELRRVRRLIVSWNWGRGLGIITQTSMLRIFDPMEMYTVIDTLQRTVEELKSENRKLSDLVGKLEG